MSLPVKTSRDALKMRIIGNAGWLCNEHLSIVSVLLVGSIPSMVVSIEATTSLNDGRCLLSWCQQAWRRFWKDLGHVGQTVGRTLSVHTRSRNSADFLHLSRNRLFDASVDTTMPKLYTSTFSVYGRDMATSE